MYLYVLLELYVLLCYKATPSGGPKFGSGKGLDSPLDLSSVLNVRSNEREATIMILMELTSAQRSMIMDMVHAKMDAMREADSNSWLTSEYAELENVAYQMYVDCAE